MLPKSSSTSSMHGSATARPRSNCGTALDCDWLFGSRTETHRCRPAQAKRDAGTIATGLSVARRYRTAFLKMSDTVYVPARRNDSREVITCDKREASAHGKHATK